MSGAGTGPRRHWRLRAGLIALSVGFVGLVVAAPLANVVVQAFRGGVGAYLEVFIAPAVLDTAGVMDDARLGTAAGRESLRSRLRQELRSGSATGNVASIRMTMLSVLVAVPLGTAFGLSAAWCLAHFRFAGRAVLERAIELPLAVSPVVAGLMFVLLLGAGGLLGGWTAAVWWPDPMSLRVSPLGFGRWRQGILFTPLAAAVASAFVTLPIVARTVLPLMRARGSQEEAAARLLGASGPRMFLSVTLPGIRWGLFYGVMLCAARTVGEFGAVSVLSGGGEDNHTIPLRIEQLWLGGDTQGAFALATIPAALGLLAIFFKAAAGTDAGQAP